MYSILTLKPYNINEPKYEHNLGWVLDLLPVVFKDVRVFREPYSRVASMNFTALNNASFQTYTVDRVDTLVFYRNVVNLVIRDIHVRMFKKELLKNV